MLQRTSLIRPFSAKHVVQELQKQVPCGLYSQMVQHFEQVELPSLPDFLLLVNLIINYKLMDENLNINNLTIPVLFGANTASNFDEMEFGHSEEIKDFEKTYAVFKVQSFIASKFRSVMIPFTNA